MNTVLFISFDQLARDLFARFPKAERVHVIAPDIARAVVGIQTCSPCSHKLTSEKTSVNTFNYIPLFSDVNALADDLNRIAVQKQKLAANVPLSLKNIIVFRISIL